jgi:hypothetical protein
MGDGFQTYVTQFEAAEEAAQDARRESEQCRDYYDGHQLTEIQRATLKRRKQPIVIENLIRPKIDSLCGLERQSRTDPKAYPRTQAHDDEAHAATDALRYVSDDQDVDIKRSHVFQNMLVEGYGAVEVGAHRTRDAIDPKVTLIPWERIYYDPHSSAHDFADAEFMGYVTWMDADKAKAKWEDKAEIIDATMSKPTGSNHDTYDDKPKWTYWADSKRKRIRINTHYCLKGGVWHRGVFTLAGELEAAEPSPFIDDEGNPENPLILQSAFVDRENHRYGIVRDFLTLQDEVNKRRSKFLHMVNENRVRVSRAFTGDAEAVRAEFARPDGVIIADAGEVEELGMGERAMGQFNLLADTRASLKGNIGPNATLQGKQGEGQSGRAILALQQAGMTEMTPLLDNLRHFTLRMYRQIWNRIRQFWTEERWVRVTDDEKNIRFVGLNVTQGHQAMMKIGEAVKSGQLPMEVARQYETQIMLDPSMQQPANQVAELDVDIEIEEVNETPTLQYEQFEALVQLASTGMVPIPPEMIIQASNLRDKQKLLQMLEEQKEAQSQPDPMQEIAAAGAQAQVEEMQSKAALNMAKAQTETLRPGIEGAKLGLNGL